MEARHPYPAYRYVMLTIIMMATVAIEIQWLTHAAVVRPAEVFYQGQFDPEAFMNIDFLAMVYMLAFLVMSFPASYIIATYGIKTGISIGAIMLGIFGSLKAIFAHSFTGLVITQTGLAIAQPFLLNAVTAFTARWFPLFQRGMAAGLLALAQYIGIIIAMLVTPALVGSDPDRPGYGSGFEQMLWIYGIISMVAALACLILVRERPKGIEAESSERYSFFKGLGHILQKRDMLITMFLFLIGLGIFNAISSMTDSIAAEAGVKDSDGLIGGLMLIGGIVGAVIIPGLSDKMRKRKPFILLCIGGMIPAVAGMAFAGQLTPDHQGAYTLSLVSSFILGFFVMSAGPIGFQYAAEINHPAPESASQGILLWVGQLTGMIFVAGMSLKNNLYLVGFMTAFTIMALMAFAVALFLRESPMIRNSATE